MLNADVKDTQRPKQDHKNTQPKKRRKKRNRNKEHTVCSLQPSPPAPEAGRTGQGFGLFPPPAPALQPHRQLPLPKHAELSRSQHCTGPLCLKAAPPPPPPPPLRGKALPALRSKLQPLLPLVSSPEFFLSTHTRVCSHPF